VTVTRKCWWWSTGQELRIAFDELLCAVGRAGAPQGYGLEELGIPDRQRTVETNEYLQTLYPNIYAAGDVAGPYQFTHTAAHQAWYAAVNALFGDLKKFKADYSRDPLGHLHRPGGRARGPERAGSEGKGIAVRSHEATALTTWTAPLPTARPMAS
jgi:pyruvate/2-oxoglutarate dehydrogenase complex dihydrolipoamide dehydrogenase (E3) component